jgi:hypothetical protein
VVDDGDPAFRGSWRSVANTKAQNGSARFWREGKPGKKVEWKLAQLVPAGTYDVYVWRFEHSRTPTPRWRTASSWPTR